MAGTGTLVAAPQPPPTLAAWAVEQIRDLIVSGQLIPGERIYEAELAQRLGISRTPVREALQRLAREHLVKIHPNRETVVLAHAEHDVREIYQLRAALEGMAVRLLALKGESAATSVAEQLFAVVEQMRVRIARQDYEELLDLDLTFHDAVLRATGNERLYDAALAVRSQTRRYLSVPLHYPMPDEYHHTLAEHRAIAEAVRERQADLAERRMRAHIMDRGEHIARVVGNLEREPIPVSPAGAARY